MSCVGVSFRVVIGSHYSLDWLAKPMNRVRPASASEFLLGGVVRSAGCLVSASSSELLLGRVIYPTSSQSRLTSSVLFQLLSFYWVALFARRDVLCRRHLPSCYRVALFTLLARRADESRPSDISFRVFIGWRCSLGGMSCLGVSFRVVIG